MHGDKWQTFFYTFYYIYRQNGTLYENNDIIGRYLSAENNEKLLFMRGMKSALIPVHQFVRFFNVRVYRFLRIDAAHEPA